MKTVLVFAGTTEGRELTEALDRSGVPCHACVATEYGHQVLKTSDRVQIHRGRLDAAGMRDLYGQIGCEIVVDATHPYAEKVTETIRESIENTDIRYIRLLRSNDGQAECEDILYYDSAEDCIRGLESTEGNILLTTGSKQLALFTASESLKSRLYARVLPGTESLKLCLDAGLEGGRIIAMQGPFSEEMNIATIREFDIKHLVSKESGITGGVDSKLAAAKKTGAKVHMVKRPAEGCVTGLTVQETIDELEKELGTVIDKGRLHVILAGIGPGSKECMTKEVLDAVETADCIFGAKRLLASVSSKAIQYPYYRKEDILPVLDKLQKESHKDMHAVILFSGDSGFYSGASSLFTALAEKKEEGIIVSVLPGISSLSLLAARLGESWQDGELISTHGVSEEIWTPCLLESLHQNKKTFLLTSGVRDINIIGRLLSEESGLRCRIYLGYQLSYPEENVFEATPEECENLTAEGLYAAMILSEAVQKRILVPVLKDEDFLRDKVPMTKEEIRKLSVCNLQLKEGDVVYDIGSGSGSVAVQTAALSASLRVYALECDDTAVSLIHRNVEKAGLKNVTVIQATAPEGLSELPKADACFIGGSKGHLKEILTELQRINPRMRVVINAVSLESITETNRILTEMQVEDLCIEQVSVTKVKELGNYHMLSANNPVFIFSFVFKEQES